MEETQRELDACRARYEAMVEHAPEAIVTVDVQSGRFTEVNRAACALFGHSREELLERGPASLSPERQPDGVPSVEAAERELQRAVRGERPMFEWTHLDRDGELIPCRVHLARVPGEPVRVRGSVWDLRELRYAEAERNRLLAVHEATPDLIGVADARGRTLYLNPAGRALLGLGEEEDVRAYDMASFHSPGEDEQVNERILPAAIREGVWRGEGSLRTRSGEDVPVHQTVIAHYGANGEVEHFSTIMRDRRAAIAAEELERQVFHAQKLESLGLMAGAIAHDFNNILVAILANASLLQRLCAENDRVLRISREIEGAADRAAELAKGMLDYSGHAQREMEALDLRRLFAELSTLVTASISKKVRLRTVIPPELPWVWADAVQLRQILLNLVLNGAEAIGDAAGTVSIEARVEEQPRRVVHDYREEPQGPWLRIDVRDDGCGMEEAVRERVFDPFYSTKRMGRGLGLASVLGIVKGHGGAIEVESVMGQGTCFSVWLPFAAGEGVQPSSRPAAHVAGTGRRVLLVDDEAAVRAVARRCLSHLGFEVVETAGAIEALERFVEAPAEWDAVLLDVTMPDVGGVQVLSRLLEVRPSLPVLLSSGYGAPEAVDELGAKVAFLPKPYTLESLERALGELIPLATAEAPP